MAVTHGSGTRSTSAYIGTAKACSAIPTFEAGDQVVLPSRRIAAKRLYPNVSWSTVMHLLAADPAHRLAAFANL